MGKTFTVDPISKRRLKNLGEEDRFYLRDHHEPIISKTVFYKAQDIMNKRGSSRALADILNRKKYSRQYSFSCMLRCGFCGATLSRRAWNAGSQYSKVIWHCLTHTRDGKRFCEYSKGIDEKVIEDAFLTSYKKICTKEENVLDEFLDKTTEVLGKNKKNTGIIDQLKKEKFILQQRRSKLCDEYLECNIEKSLFEEKKAEIDDNLYEIDYQISNYKSEMKCVDEFAKRIEQFRKYLSENNEIKEFDRAIFESVVKVVYIGGYDENGNVDPSLINIVYKPVLKDDDTIKGKSVKYDSEYLNLIELFSFHQPHKHIVFSINKDGSREKILKHHTKVKISMMKS